MSISEEAPQKKLEVRQVKKEERNFLPSSDEIGLEEEDIEFTAQPQILVKQIEKLLRKKVISQRQGNNMKTKI